MRDSQRSKLYEAERDAFINLEQGEYRDDDLATISDIVTWLNKISATPWMRKHHSVAADLTFFDYDMFKNSHHIWVSSEVRVLHGYGARTARGGRSELKFPRWARSKPVVLHELAHLITTREYGYTAVAAHGREFCGTYLDLVGRFMGKDDRRALKQAMVARKVKSTPKRQGRTLSPAEREAAAQRFAAARAAKSGGQR